MRIRRTVNCQVVTTDRYGRSVSRCSVGGDDIQAWLARKGWALAYRQYSKDYVPDEEAARAAKAGIWASQFDAPWDWRKYKGKGQAASYMDIPARKLDAAPVSTASSDACAIKGNINSKGEKKIYHVPGSGSYEATRIDTSQG